MVWYAIVMNDTLGVESKPMMLVMRLLQIAHQALLWETCAPLAPVKSERSVTPEMLLHVSRIPPGQLSARASLFLIGVQTLTMLTPIPLTAWEIQ